MNVHLHARNVDDIPENHLIRVYLISGRLSIYCLLILSAVQINLHTQRIKILYQEI